MLSNLSQRGLKSSTVFLQNTSQTKAISLKKFFGNLADNSKIYMPVLDNIINKHIPTQPLKGCGIIAVQHTLGTMIPVIDGLTQLGAEGIFVMGKSYSECEQVVQELEKMKKVYYRRQGKQIAISQFTSTFQANTSLLWQDLKEGLKKDQSIKRVIVLDHGGYAMQIIPDINIPIVTVEKTTNGIEKAGYLPFPRVEMATSAIKRKLESPFIAQAITEKLINSLLLPELRTASQTCAIIGYGSVGAALAEHLLSLGHTVFVYDANPSKLRNLPVGVKVVESLSTAIRQSHVIFGCTGKDITQGNLELLENSPLNKTLVSASSDDVEFLSFLRQYQSKSKKKSSNPMETIQEKNRMGATIKVLRGGFPANFDNSFESVPADYIQLTRSLIIAATIQAAQIKDNAPVESYMLDPLEQISIARDFISFLKKRNLQNSHLEEYERIFSRPLKEVINWVEENSGGSVCLIEESKQIFPL